MISNNDQLKSTTAQKAKIFRLLILFFTNAVKYDNWGQCVEAVDTYQELDVLLSKLESDARSKSSNTNNFSLTEVNGLRKICNCIKLRVAALEKIDFKGPSCDEMEMVRDMFMSIIAGGTFPFEIELYNNQNIDEIARFESLTPIKKEIQVLEFKEAKDDDSSDGSEEEENISFISDEVEHVTRYFDNVEELKDEEENLHQNQNQNQNQHAESWTNGDTHEYKDTQPNLNDLTFMHSHSVFSATAIVDGGKLKLPKIPTSTKSYLSVTVQKVGLKDAGSYIDPYVIVTVADARACVVEQQFTPVAARQTGQYVYFDDVVVNLDIPLEHVLEGNCSVFFEFMHYKPKKGKVSCRCWSLIEKDEIVSGNMGLELYQKPADFRKKRIHLHTIKELFFYIVCDIRTTTEGRINMSSSARGKSGKVSF